MLHKAVAASAEQDQYVSALAPTMLLQVPEKLQRLKDCNECTRASQQCHQSEEDEHPEAPRYPLLQHRAELCDRQDFTAGQLLSMSDDGVHVVLRTLHVASASPAAAPPWIDILDSAPAWRRLFVQTVSLPFRCHH